MKNEISNKSVCEICGAPISEANARTARINAGKEHCEKCAKVVELRNNIVQHWNEFRDRQIQNEEGEFGPWRSGFEKDGICVRTRMLEPHQSTFTVENRSKNVKALIKEIDDARRYLYFDVGAYFDLLESTVKKENTFWKDGGNFYYYVQQSLLSTVVLKLSDYLDDAQRNLSKYSLKKIRNKMETEKRNLFQNQVVISEERFEKSGNVVKTPFHPFPIEEFLAATDNLLKTGGETLKALKEYRDNTCAHIGLQKPDSNITLTIIDLRRIYNFLKIIYDGLFYACAPDAFANLVVDYNIWYENLNAISSSWRARHPQAEDDKD